MKQNKGVSDLRNDAVKAGLGVPGADNAQQVVVPIREDIKPLEQSPEEYRRSEFRSALEDPKRKISAMLANEAPPQKYLIDQILPAGEPTLLVGTGGSGKSLMALTAAAHVATGQKFARWEIPTPGRVLVVNFEDTVEQVWRRMRNIVCTMAGVTTVEEMSNTAEPSEWRRKLMKNFEVLSLRHLGFSLDDNVLHDEIARFAAGSGRFDWVVLDPLAHIVPAGVDVNLQAGATEVHRHIGRMVRELGAAVTVVHHASKAGASTRQGEDRGALAASGSHLLTDLARNVWRVAPYSGKDIRAAGLDPAEAYSGLTIPKNNFGETVFEPEYFRKAAGGAPDWDPTKSRPGRSDADRILDVLGGAELTSTAWDKAAQAELGVGRRPVAKLREELFRNGKIERFRDPDHASAGAPAWLYRRVTEA